MQLRCLITLLLLPRVHANVEQNTMSKCSLFIYIFNSVNQFSRKILPPKEKGKLFEKDNSIPRGVLTIIKYIKGRANPLSYYYFSIVSLSYHCYRMFSEVSTIRTMIPLYCFSSTCVRLCLTQLLPVANDFPHTSQLKGFSFVCVRVCLIKSPFSLNCLSQY